jgi:YfiH family protein
MRNETEGKTETSDVIYPEIFAGHNVFAFFTGMDTGSQKDRVRATAGIGEEDIYYPIQEHSDRIMVLSEKGRPEEPADAVITMLSGVLVGVRVADCVPALIYDPNSGVVGAVHAGWRGTASRILEKTIRLMEKEFGASPADMLLAIGPAIRRCCYEVGEEVLRKVITATGEAQNSNSFHSLKGGRHYVDLPLANRVQAGRAGIRPENVWLSGECSFCGPAKYHSYRREKGTGRQGGFIGKKKA